MWLVHIKRMCGPSEHAQPLYFIYYEWVYVQSAVLKGPMIKRYCLAWDADLYAPQGVDLEGSGSPSRNGYDTVLKVA